MSIKIANTEVISNSRVVNNISNIYSVYTNLQPNITTITNLIDFDKPVMTTVMTGNQSFTEANKAIGGISILLLDRSSNNRNPTFSGNIKWGADGSTPQWQNFRYWVISFTCKNSTEVLAAASGYTF